MNNQQRVPSRITLLEDEHGPGLSLWVGWAGFIGCCVVAILFLIPWTMASYTATKNNQNGTWVILLPMVPGVLVVCRYVFVCLLNRTIVRVTSTQLTVHHGPLWSPFTPRSLSVDRATVADVFASRIKLPAMIYGRNSEVWVVVVELKDDTQQDLLRGLNKQVAKYLAWQIRDWCGFPDETPKHSS